MVGGGDALKEKFERARGEALTAASQRARTCANAQEWQCAVEEADFAGVDAVVHMAELSNDPVGDLLGEITYDINHAASVRLLLGSAQPDDVTALVAALTGGRGVVERVGERWL